MILGTEDQVKIQSTSILSDGYGLIPKKITRDKNLTLEAKAIYAYLASFAGANNSCYPGKKMMISELSTTEKRFDKNIKILKEYGYIKVYKRRNGNRNDSNLYELIMDTRDIEKIKMQFDTSQFDSGQFDSGQFDGVQIDPPINNSINNNSINNNSINNKHINKVSKSNIKTFAKLHEQNIGLINGVAAEYLIELSETIDVSLFKRAIEIATDKGKCNKGYISGILKQWSDNNIRTFKDLKAYEVGIRNRGVSDGKYKDEYRKSKYATELENEDESIYRKPTSEQLEEARKSFDELRKGK